MRRIIDYDWLISYSLKFTISILFWNLFFSALFTFCQYPISNNNTNTRFRAQNIWNNISGCNTVYPHSRGRDRSDYFVPQYRSWWKNLYFSIDCERVASFQWEFTTRRSMAYNAWIAWFHDLFDIFQFLACKDI